MFEPDDFSWDRLRGLFRLSLEMGYEPVLFGDEDNVERFILWRHDIDLDLEAVRQMARVEYEEGIRSTYFMMTNSWFYNLFSADGKRTVELLRELGHRVGLHSDLEVARDVDVDSHEVERRVAHDFELVDHVFERGVFDRVVSFHNPPSAVLRQSYSFYSAYQPKFFGQIKYLSDSNRHWREGAPEIWLKQGERPQFSILLHPILWNTEGRTMPEGAAAFVKQRSDELMARMEADDIRVR